MYIQYYVILWFNDNRREIVLFWRPQATATVYEVFKIGNESHHGHDLGQKENTMAPSSGAPRGQYTIALKREVERAY